MNKWFFIHCKGGRLTQNIFMIFIIPIPQEYFHNQDDFFLIFIVYVLTFHIIKYFLFFFSKNIIEMADLVNLVISSNVSGYGNERRYPRKMLVSELKVYDLVL